MIWMAYSSLKADRDIFNDTFALPRLGSLHFENYTNAWREARFGDYFFHSVLITGVSVIPDRRPRGDGGVRGLTRNFYHPLGRAAFWLFLAGHHDSRAQLSDRAASFRAPLRGPKLNS